jgi:hypothetical protein
MSDKIRKPADPKWVQEHGDLIATLTNKMHESVRSNKKKLAPGFSDEDKSSCVEMQLADVTQYTWKTLSLTQWKRDLTNRATAIVVGIKYFQQYQPKLYSLSLLRTLREELTLVFQSLPVSGSRFQWWDQLIYDEISASEYQEDNQAEGLEIAVAFSRKMKGYQKELQVMVERISAHELSQADLGLSASIHQGLVLITEVCNVAHSNPSVLMASKGVA